MCPQYEVSHINSETQMLHSKHTDIYAAGPEQAIAMADKLVDEENGYGQSADGSQFTMARPRFTVSVREVE